MESLVTQTVTQSDGWIGTAVDNTYAAFSNARSSLENLISSAQSSLSGASNTFLNSLSSFDGDLSSLYPAKDAPVDLDLSVIGDHLQIRSEGSSTDLLSGQISFADDGSLASYDLASPMGVSVSQTWSTTASADVDTYNQIGNSGSGLGTFHETATA